MSLFHSGSFWKIKNKSKNTVLAAQASVADSFLSRLCGLIPSKGLAPGGGLIITRCKSIHMLFMRFPIDAIFVDKNDIVVGLVEGIRPFEFSRTYWKASYVIELPINSILQSKSEPGDSVEFFEQMSS